MLPRAALAWGSSVVVFVVVSVFGCLWSLQVRADIVVSEDDWEDLLVEVGTEPGLGNAGTPEPSVVTTDDGRKSLYFSGDPGGVGDPAAPDNLAYAIYSLNVTQLPGGGRGPERFPITVEARHFFAGGMVIRNLTVAPIPNTGFQDQASFAGVMIRENEGEIFALGTGEQPFDPCFDFLDRDEGFDIIQELWSTIGLADANATTATDIPGGETGIVETVTVMLDLVKG